MKCCNAAAAAVVVDVVGETGSTERLDPSCFVNWAHMAVTHCVMGFLQRDGLS